MFTLAWYRNRAMLWVFVTALGTVGYTTVDKLAAEGLAPGPISAARYAVWEAVMTIPILWAALKLIVERTGVESSRSGLGDWGWALVAALFIFCAYWLVLWAYQLSPYTSYVSALRQFSIVIGVVAVIVLARRRAEPAPPWLRAVAAAVITLGILCISMAS
jgi:hypothetical protein